MFFLISKILLENIGEYGDKMIFLGLNPVSCEVVGYVLAKDDAEAAEKLRLKKITIKGENGGYFLPKDRYEKDLKILNQEPNKIPPYLPKAVFVYDIEQLAELDSPLEQN